MPALSRKAAHFAVRNHPRLSLRVAEYLKRAVDLALAAAILIAPLFMGGRGPIGRLVFVSIVGIAAMAWFFRQCFVQNAKWRWSGAETVVLLGGLLIVAQLVQLPQVLLFKLSPAIGELLPLWRSNAASAVHLGNWSTLSLTPEDTRGGLAIFLAYTLLFLVLVQRIESVEHIQRTMRWLAIAVVGMAAIGMLQLLFGNGKFLWVYEHPSRDTYAKVIGTFQNQNHFAHFVALGVGPLIYWLQRSWCAEQSQTTFKSGRSRGSPWPGSITKHFLAVCMGVVIVASLLTYSRGGVLAVSLAMLLTVMLYAWNALLGRKSLIAVGLFGVVVAAALAIYGHKQLAAKMETLVSGSFENVSQARLELWKAHWRAIPRFPIFGTGVGSHREVYPIFMQENYDVEFTHGENGYFQLLLETGVAGLALLLAGFALVLRWCLGVLTAGKGNLRLIGLGGAILPGIAASLLHSWGDFVWYIPACMTLTLVLAACACRLYQLSGRESSPESQSSRSTRQVSHPREVPLSRLATAAVAVGILLCSVSLIYNRVGPALASPHWDSFSKLARTKNSADSSQFSVESIGDRDKLAGMEEQLDEVLRHDPDDARALLKSAAIRLARFEFEQRFAANPMRLSQIRDAALASGFPTKQAQEGWLNLAIGDNIRRLDLALDHCRRALRISPLEGVGYVYMADLCFLNDPRGTAKNEYLQQAYQLRPHKGEVLFALGVQALLSNDRITATKHLRQAFRQDSEVQTLIVQAIASQLPASDFLRTFEPNLTGLRRLFWQYRTTNQEADARLVGLKFAEALQHETGNANSVQAIAYWHEAQGVYALLGELEKALECERHAVDAAPYDFELRRTFARLLAQNHQHAEAATHFEWCLRRHPEDDNLRQELSQLKMKKTQPRRTAGATSNAEGTRVY